MTRQELEDERTFLLRSLEDLDREHEAGDLSDEDHAMLRDGYIARTAEVLRSLEGRSRPPAAASPAAVSPTPASPGTRATPRPHRRRRVLVVAAVVAVLGCAAWAVVVHLSARLPGESLTGSIALSRSQQTQRTLAQAETLEGQGDVVDALKLYESVLQKDPTQETALAEVGWLEYEAGAQGKKADLLSLGLGQEQQAERLDPGAFAPHLYLGSMSLAQGDSTTAVAQYREFLADRPPRATVVAAEPFIIEAFSAAHQTAPALPVGGTSTTG